MSGGLRGLRRRAVLLPLTLALALSLVACGPLALPTPPGTDAPATAGRLSVLVVDPPASARAARPSDATYSLYQGVVCGVVPRPEHGYTVRYPKIWLAREQGPTTWLADNSDDQRLVAVVHSQPAPPDPADLAAPLADAWRARGLRDLRLEPVEGAIVGGLPAARWDLRYTAEDGTPMVGYTAATLANGRLYRVEAALPAARYERLERAAAIVAELLLITRPREG